MNYKKIHDDLILYCKLTDPLERVVKRNPLDQRLQDPDTLYTETHHIIPKHENGDNSIDNLVKLLPEEHYLIHLLRYKWKKSRNDFLACRFIINGYTSKELLKNKIPSRVTNKIVSIQKQHSYNFRNNIGWHTEEGRARISNSKKGMAVYKDSKTLEVVGMHPTNHPNVVNGTWVHTSTGTTTGIDSNGNRIVLPSGYFNKECSTYTSSYAGTNKGSKNPNYKGVTEEEKKFLIGLLQKAVVENHLIRNKVVEIFNLEFFIPKGMKPISIVWVVNHLGTMNTLVEKYNIAYGTSIKYNPYYRSKETKEKIANSVSKYCWMVNSKNEVLYLEKTKMNTYVKKGYKRGRKW